MRNSFVEEDRNMHAFNKPISEIGRLPDKTKSVSDATSIRISREMK